MGKIFLGIPRMRELQLLDGLCNYSIDNSGHYDFGRGIYEEGSAFKIDDMKILLYRVMRMKLTVMGIDCFIPDQTGIHELYSVIIHEEFNKEGHESPTWFIKPFCGLVEEIKQINLLDSALFDPTVAPIPPEWSKQDESLALHRNSGQGKRNVRGFPVKNEKPDECLKDILPFHSIDDMIQRAKEIFDLRERIRQEPENASVLEQEEELTLVWHERCQCFRDSNPLITLMHSNKLKPVEREILIFCCIDGSELGSCQQIAEHVASTRCDYYKVLVLLAKNRTLYNKRLIYHHAIFRSDPLWSRWVLLSPRILKNILGFKSNSDYAQILTVTENDLMRHVKRIARLLERRSQCILHPKNIRKSVDFGSIMSYIINMYITLENYQQWNLSTIIRLRNWRYSSIIIILIGKHLKWLCSRNIVCSRTGLAAALAGPSDKVISTIDEHITYLTENNWIQQSASGPNDSDKWYELHPNAITRLGLNRFLKP